MTDLADELERIPVPLECLDTIRRAAEALRGLPWLLSEAWGESAKMRFDDLTFEQRAARCDAFIIQAMKKINSTEPKR